LPTELWEPAPASEFEARSLDELERQAIIRALEETQGNRTRAAIVLGISRSTLKRKLATLGLKERRCL
jgi:DNA-binding NtrC family response regulator